MRLSQMRNRINEESIKLNLDNLIKTPLPNAESKISNHEEVIEALENLSKFKVLSEDIERMRKFSAIYNTSLNEITIANNTLAEFNKHLVKLKMKCDNIVEILDELPEIQEPETVSVKLPSVQNLSVLANYIIKIEKIFSQLIVNDKVNGKVELKKVDSGSIWLDIRLGGSLAISLIGSAAWSAAVVKKKYLEGELLKKQVEAYGIKNEALSSVKEQIDKEFKSMSSMEAENIINQYDLQGDPEYKNRVIYAVKEFTKLINEGVEIHHSLLAPEEVKNLFPDYSKPDLIESKILKLKENNVE